MSAKSFRAIECDVYGNTLTLYGMKRKVSTGAWVTLGVSIAVLLIVVSLPLLLVFVVIGGCLAPFTKTGRRARRSSLTKALADGVKQRAWAEQRVPMEQHRFAGPDGHQRAVQAAQDLARAWRDGAGVTQGLYRLRIEARPLNPDSALRPEVKWGAVSPRAVDFRLHIAPLPAGGPVPGPHPAPAPRSAPAPPRFGGPLGRELTVLAAHQREMSDSEKAQWLSICDTYQRIGGLSRMENDEIGLPQSALAAREAALADLRTACKRIRSGIRDRRGTPAQELSFYTADRFARHDELSLDDRTDEDDEDRAP